ncbi:MAG TPA: hypothetical protein VKQ30_25425 [Ktedonobacterales bacterium]|nr:hypothetical protein [Ktedonobacterales bacterium]
MGSTTKGPYDPTVTQPIDTLLGNSTSGCILIHNLSQYELYVTTPDAAMTSFVAAWGWRRFDARDPLPIISWSIAATPAQTNPPLSAVFVESYEVRTEAPPQYFGQYQRQTSVGSGAVTTTLQNAISPDGGSHNLSVVYDSANARMELQPGGSAGTHPLGMLFTYVDNGGVQRIAFVSAGDGSGGVAGTAAANLRWDASGDLITIGGLATVGIGTAVKVAEAAHAHVTSTGFVNLLSFVAPNVAGRYLVSLYASIAGVSNGVAVTASVTSTDEDGNTLSSAPFFGLIKTSAGAVSYGAFSAVATGTGTQGTNAAILAANPLMVEVASGGTMTVQFHDSAGTPNDFVTAVIYRI